MLTPITERFRIICPDIIGLWIAESWQATIERNKKIYNFALQIVLDSTECHNFNGKSNIYSKLQKWLKARYVYNN